MEEVVAAGAAAPADPRVEALMVAEEDPVLPAALAGTVREVAAAATAPLAVVIAPDLTGPADTVRRQAA